jgi:hypothetical protein
VTWSPFSRGLVGVAGAAVAISGLLGLATPHVANAAADPCVGVIVDGRLYGGALTYSCAKGDPTSGLAALRMAGYSYAFVPRQPGLVCQINSKPACSDTSTTSYWSYWHRAPGSSTWVYSSKGAGSYDPANGSTEAWVWQQGGKKTPPSIGQKTICPQAASPAPTRATTKAPRATGAGGGSSTGQTTRGRAAGGAVTPAMRRPSSSPTGRPTGAISASPAATSVSPDTTQSFSSTAPEASRLDGALSQGSGGGGPPWPGLALGAALALGIGAAATIRAVRSRGNDG